MMKPNERNLIKERIHALQLQQKEEQDELKEQAKLSYESLNPINQLKKGWAELVDTKNKNGDIVGGIVGLSVGYISKKVLLGPSHNPIKRILGTLAQFAIANVVSKYGDTIKSKGGSWIKSLLSKKNSNQKEFSEA